MERRAGTDKITGEALSWGSGGEGQVRYKYCIGGRPTVDVWSQCDGWPKIEGKKIRLEPLAERNSRRWYIWQVLNIGSGEVGEVMPSRGRGD